MHETKRERCVACKMALQPGDMVFTDHDGGFIHDDCAEDDEAFVGEDGKPLSLDAEFPRPFAWRPA